MPWVDAYNCRTGTWEQRKDMPSARSNTAADVVSGLVYCVGGAEGPDGLSSLRVERYDPVEDTWDVLPSLDRPSACQG